MSIPVSSGIGTGAAQVFGQDKTYEALKDASRTLFEVTEYKNKIAAKKAADMEEAKNKNLAAVAELQSKMNFDRKGLKPADVDLSTQEFANFRKKFQGKFSLIASGDPDASNEFYSELDMLKGNVAKRMENYDILKNQVVDVNKNPENYSQAQIDLSAKLYDTPDVNMADYSGVFAQKVNLGDPIGEILADSGDIFFASEYSKETDEGKKSFTGDIFKKEGESLSAWKNRVASIPSLQTKLIAVYEDRDDVEKDAAGRVTTAGMETIYKLSHDVAKSTLKQTTQSENTTKKDETSGGGGFGYDSDNWNVQKTIDRDGNEWVNINKKTGGNITIKATKLFGVDGKFYEMTVGNIISYRHDNKNRVIAKVGGVGFDENGNKITISEREMFLDESQWGLITNTIGSDIGLLNLKRSLKAVNVAVPRKKQSGETSYDWSNEKPE